MHPRETPEIETETETKLKKRFTPVKSVTPELGTSYSSLHPRETPEIETETETKLKKRVTPVKSVAPELGTSYNSLHPRETPEIETEIETKLKKRVTPREEVKPITPILTKKAGFRQTLKRSKKIVKPLHENPNIICKAILKSGKNLTKKYYFPSEFPNLTKLKPVIQKGGITKKRRGKNRKRTSKKI